MQVDDINTGLEILDRATCQELLESSVTGRFAVIVDNRPVVFPVVYSARPPGLTVRMSDGAMLTTVLRGPVTFQVDHFDPDDQTGWSVLAHGRATLGGDPNAPVKPWRHAVLPHVVRFTITEFSGRRLLS